MSEPLDVPATAPDSRLVLEEWFALHGYCDRCAANPAISKTPTALTHDLSCPNCGDMIIRSQFNAPDAR